MGERPAPVPGVDLLFTDDDACEILEYLEDEKLVCSGCGSLLADCLDTANTWAFKAEIYQCHGCAAADRAARSIDPDARAGLRSRVWLPD